jgi:hypothetical protein
MNFGKALAKQEGFIPNIVFYLIIYLMENEGECE